MNVSEACIYDCPLFNLHKIGTQSIVYPEEYGIIVYPGESITARVQLHHTLNKRDDIAVHIPSTLARLGMDVFLIPCELEQVVNKSHIPEYLSVLIVNQGFHHVLIREERDVIAVADHARLKAYPVPVFHAYPQAHSEDYSITLHLDSSYLMVIEQHLAVHSESGVRYIDPHARHLFHITEMIPFPEEQLDVEPGEHYVFPLQERCLEIPRGMIGVFNDDVADGLQHSSAILAYPHKEEGSEGRQFAVEYLVQREMTIVPGMPAITFHLYQASAERIGPERYIRQTTIRPSRLH